MSRATAFLPDPALTPLAVEIMQDGDYIASEVSPEVRVQLKSDIYWDYGTTTYLESVDDTGGGEEDDVSEGGWEPSEASYNCKDYGHQMPMSAVLLQGSRYFGDDIRQAFTRICASRVNVKREKRVAARVFDASLYPAGYAGAPAIKWDAANAVPMKNIQAAALKLLGKGQGELILVCGVDAWVSLSNDPSVLNALQPTSQTGIATKEQVAKLVGISAVYVANAKADGTNSYIWNTKHAVLLVRNKNPNRFSISAWHTFLLEVNGQGYAVYNWQDPKKGAHGSEWVKSY
jgi:hypothetical protein